MGIWGAEWGREVQGMRGTKGTRPGRRWGLGQEVPVIVRGQRSPSRLPRGETAPFGGSSLTGLLSGVSAILAQG